MFLTIDSTNEEVSLACITLKGICGHVGIPRLVSYQIELSLDEILINIVEHDLQFTKGVPIEIHFDVTEKELNLTIRYKSDKELGAWKNRQILPDAKELPERGFGVYLVNKIMDEVRYERDKGINHFHLYKSLEPN